MRWRVAWAAAVLLVLGGSLGAAQSPTEEPRSPPRLPWENRYDETRDEYGSRERDRDRDYSFRQSNVYPSTDKLAIREATYFVVASRMVRPGQVYRVAVNILHSPLPMTVRASIQRNGVEITASWEEVREGVPETLLMRMPPTSVPGDYRLRVEGNYNNLQGGQAFLNESQLVFTQRSMTIFIQCDKPFYMQGQEIRFRTVPINTELKAFDDTVEVRMLDPNKRIMRRWLSRQSNLGTVSLSYQLSDQPVFGEWTIEVIAQGQVEEKTIYVEEYYQTRFEVNVTMPAFFFDKEPYIHGLVIANYTSGAPVVRANLTLKASFRPIDKNRLATGTYENLPDRYITFDEEYPSWFNPPDLYDNTVPKLRFFNGTYRFKYPMQDLLQLMPSSNEGIEVVIEATVGEHFLNEIITGYSVCRIYNSSIKIEFMGGSPQVFKPGMPFDLNLVASFHDGSPLRPTQLWNAQVSVRGEIVTRSTGSRTIESKFLRRASDSDAVWSMRVDLRELLGLSDNPQRAQQFLNDIVRMDFTADLLDGEGFPAHTELHMHAHESPDNKHIKVWTSTEKAKVGEYLVLHVQSNFYIESFNYVVMSKGTILLASDERMQPTIKTFALPLSPEMAPVATVVVYHVGSNGDVVADSLTFPVNGLSRNNFTVFINNKKARTGENVEVAIYGEPGSYVALSGIDRSFYAMQAGNELTYANVIEKMSHFGEDTNGTHSHSWLFHDGDPDALVHFPSPTYGIDVNRTFEFTGLVVFTDARIYRRPEHCNKTQGFLECLSNGRCYRADQRCDGIAHCDDGTDEARCPKINATDVANFRKWRFNRIQRQYDNVWLWKDVNIGPHGRFIFNIDVPKTPVHWMIGAFGMSPTKGFGMLQNALEYIAVLPFYINVEMPDSCKQGEQVGIRVSVFNYMRHNIEATVVLHNSPDYKFIHVEPHGIVQSYSPRTSFGEHQFFIWMQAQSSDVVYIPIVPVRLGDIEVRIHATTLIGSDSAKRILRVEADGLPQHRHQSVLLDLTNKAYIFQYMHVNITETPIIPYDEDRYYIFGSNKARISVVGDVVGPIFPTMPVNATSLLGLPMDCGEQTVFSFAANMYMILHMRLINQRNLTLEKRGFEHLNIGYQRALSFMNLDGSFSLFRSDWNQSAPSVWLTAYTVRIFQEASFYEWENYIFIDPKVIEHSVSWLLNHQTIDGSFYEVTWLPDRKMNSSLNYDLEHYAYRHRNISLTAHVLITLEKVKDLPSGLGARVALAAANAVRWLEQNLQLLSERGKPYEIALVAYALAVAKASTAEQMFRLLQERRRDAGELSYWSREKVPDPPYKTENQKPFSLPRLPYTYDSENIETTAYALLVYVMRQELGSESIVKWLNSQRLTDGGWASTQDTAWAMKALVDYTEKSRIRDVSGLTLTIEATALPGRNKTLMINNKNLARLQTLEIPQAWGTVKVQARGAGFAILQMHVQYNVDIKRFQTQPNVTAFDLRLSPTGHGRNNSHIRYSSCQRWTHLNESERSGMAVLDVTIPTGYIVQQQNLDKYVRSRSVRNLQRARFQPSKVLFYFDYLDNEETCVDFTVERWFPVANMSRYLAARVYDYYAPERFNESMYELLETYVLNICEVCGSSQCPYCPIYNAAMIITPPSIVILLFTYFVMKV